MNYNDYMLSIFLTMIRVFENGLDFYSNVNHCWINWNVCKKNKLSNELY